MYQQTRCTSTGVWVVFLAVATFSLCLIYRQQKIHSVHILFTVPVIVVKASFVHCLPSGSVRVCVCVEWGGTVKGGVGGCDTV